MIDLALDPVSRDLILAPRFVGGAEKITQSVNIRMRTWLGEWFLDTTHGVPYYERILGKGVRPEIVEAILRAQILDVEGVLSIKRFSISADDRTRRVTVSFEANTTEGLASGEFRIRG